MAEDQDTPQQDDEQQQSEMQAALMAALRGGQQPQDVGFTPGPQEGQLPIDPTQLGRMVGQQPAARAPAPTDDPALGGGAPAAVPALAAVAPAGPPQGSTADLESRGFASRIRPAPIPQPTDDPALSNVPKPPDLSNSRLAGLLSDYRDTQAKLQAIPPVDPKANRPKLWERVLGGLSAGAIAYGSKDPAMGARLGSQVTGRRLARAQSDYDIQTAPLLAHLQQDREGLGMTEAESRIPQANFENQLKASEEGRKQSESTGRIAQYRARAEDLESRADKFVAGSEQEDEKSPTGWTAVTFGGERKPFSPKSATAAPKTPTGEFSGWYEAFQRDNKRPPTAKEVNQHEINLKLAERPPKDESPNGWTTGETREITNKSRRFQTRVDSLEKSRVDYLGSNRPEDKQTLAAIDAEIEQNHQQIDKVQQDVLGRRAAKPGAATAAPTPAAGGGTPKYVKTATDAKGNKVGYDPVKKQWVPIPKTK